MAKRSNRSRNDAKSRKVDFSGVESGGRKRIPPGEYGPFSIVEITEEEGDAGPYWRVVSELKGGKCKGFKDYNNYSFSPKALWKLRQLLEACGLDVPESKMTLKAKSLLGLEFGGAVEDDTYKGKTRSKVVETFSVEDLEEELETDDEDEDDEEDEEETEDEDEEEEDEEDEEEVDDDEDEEEEDEPKKGKKSKKGKKGKK